MQFAKSEAKFAPSVVEAIYRAAPSRGMDEPLREIVKGAVMEDIVV